MKFKKKKNAKKTPDYDVKAPVKKTLIRHHQDGTDKLHFVRIV